MNLYYFSPNHCGCALGNLAAHQQGGWKIKDHVPVTDDFKPTQYPDTAFFNAEQYFELEPGDSEIFKRIYKAEQEEKAGSTHKQIFFSRLNKLLEEKGIPLRAIYGPDQSEPSGPADDTNKLLDHPQVCRDECA